MVIKWYNSGIKKGVNRVSRPIDLTGKRFGRLIVLERVENSRSGGTVWKCKCDCGNVKICNGERLRCGKLKSCGCLSIDTVKKNMTKHGKHGSKTYNIWKGIKQRCYQKNNIGYCDYGERGISMYDEWKNGFQSFYDYVSKLPHFGEKGYSIDRIDVNGNYEPQNIKWSTAKEQSNNKRNNLLVIYKSKTITIKQLSEITKIRYEFLRVHYHKKDLKEILARDWGIYIDFPKDEDLEVEDET